MAIKPCVFYAKTWHTIPKIHITLESIDKNTTPTQFDALWQSKKRKWNLAIGTPSGEHPLITCINCNNIPLIYHLHSQDKSLINLGDAHGVTPLSRAVSDEKCPIAEILLELGADPNITSLNRRSCLWAAATGRHVMLCVLLLKYNAIANPALDKMAEDVLETARVVLKEQRKLIAEAIECDAPNKLCDALMQMIVEYV